MTKVPLIALTVLAGILVCASLTDSELLAKNDFLIGFFNHNFVSIIAVIVTVNLVTISQIILELSRIERRFNKKVFTDARRSLHLSAAILIILLFASFLLMFLAARFASESSIVSFIYSFGILAIAEALFIMYELIKTISTISEEEP